MSLFDKMTNAIGSAGKDVAKKAKEVSEVSRCTAAIEEHKQHLQNLYLEIGKYLCENRIKDMEEPYASWFSEVDENLNRISEIEEKRRTLKGIEICQNCGAELKKDANFCNVCGGRVQRLTIEERLEKCPNCGAAVNADENFCSKCGTKIERPVVTDENSKLICHNCGEELKPGYAFCQYCGAAVIATNIESERANEDNTEQTI